MKYWLHVIIVVVLGFILGQWLPWWMVSLIALTSAFLLRMNFWIGGMFGFLAGFILWGGFALFIDIENQHILSERIGLLFNGVSGIMLVIITGMLGGLLCFLGTLLGGALRPGVSKSSNK